MHLQYGRAVGSIGTARAPHDLEQATAQMYGGAHVRNLENGVKVC